jgi:hypothetical protein
MTENEKISDVVYLMTKGYNYTAIGVILGVEKTQVFLLAEKATKNSGLQMLFSEKKSTTFSQLKRAEDRLWILKDLLVKDPFNWKLIDEWKELSAFYSQYTAL